MKNVNRAVIATLSSALLISACGSAKDKPGSDPAAKGAGGPLATSAGACTAATAKSPVRVQYAPQEVTALCEASINKVESVLKQIEEGKDSANIQNTLLRFETAMADFSDETTPLVFQKYVSTNKEVNAEGGACEEKLALYYVDIYSRRSLYQALASLKTGEPAQARLLSELLKSFEQNGLKLNDADLAEVKDLKSKLATNETKFSTNLINDKTTLLLTAQELTGATADYLGSLKKDGDKFIVTTKSTDYTEVLENVSVESTRKSMLTAYVNRGGLENMKLLEEAVELRQQIAAKLGFKTWADFRASSRMAKSAENVGKFLNNLKGKLAIRNQQDQAQLLKFKKELDPSATKLNQWDSIYLTYQLQKRDYALDNEKIREYFPAGTVIAGIFQVYSKLLGVNFVPLNVDVWEKGVNAYEIRNTSDCKLIGYFYTDLFPREGKYTHAAAFTLRSGRMMGSGEYSLPVSSIVSNFTAPTGNKPSLLTLEEVDTFFHEFGHIMHQTLTRAQFASLSGSGVAQDFVEAPSQMLENWVLNPEIMNLISGHYLKPDQKMPTAILEKMVAAKKYQQGAKYTKQLLYALYDFNLHSQNGPVDALKMYQDLYVDVVGQEPLLEGRFPGSFGHLMGGYDAGYYGYLWSEVYAQDMFSKFPENDLMNQKIGQKYRQTILEQGNMRDAIELLREFLGREPSTDAFFKMLGL